MAVASLPHERNTIPRAIVFNGYGGLGMEFWQCIRGVLSKVVRLIQLFIFPDDILPEGSFLENPFNLVYQPCRAAVGEYAKCHPTNVRECGKLLFPGMLSIILSVASSAHFLCASYNRAAVILSIPSSGELSAETKTELAATCDFSQIWSKKTKTTDLK